MIPTRPAAALRLRQVQKGSSVSPPKEDGMRALLMGLCFVAISGLVAISDRCRADEEEKVPLDKLPKAVTEAVKKKFPRAELVSAEKEKQDGKTVYEVK